MSSQKRSNLLQDVGLLLIRVMLAIVFVYHGGQKLFGLFGGGGLEGFAQYLQTLSVPLPKVSAVLAGAAEFFGGLCLLSGVFFRLAAIPMVFTMLVAGFVAHAGAFSAQKGGGEYALVLAVVVAGLGLIGPGRLAVTWSRPKKRK